MKPFRHRFGILVTCICILMSSCGGSKGQKPQEITKLKAHQWYYFTQRGFYPIQLPQQAPEVAAKPWTEAIRISAAGNNTADNCALVNRLGILDFTTGKPELFRDIMLFDQVTADTLLFTEDGPVFHLYKNTHFNQQGQNSIDGQAKTKDEAFARPLLVRYDRQQKLCTPVLTYGNMNLPLDAQLTSIIPRDDIWIGAVKTLRNNVVSFTYLTFQALDKDGTIPDATNQVIPTQEIDADSFRQAQQPAPLKDAPAPLQQLFAQVPESFEFYLSCREEGKLAPVLYDNTRNQSPAGGYLAQGWGFLSTVGAAALFSDGTVYITKSLLLGGDDAQTPADGVIAFRLPKLPAGFSYGEFTIQGSTLYAGWEETDFYKTARSGFIAVNLSTIGAQLH